MVGEERDAQARGDESPLVDGEDYRVVLVTAPSDEVAERLARGLVESGQAACVNLVRGLRSLFRWEGAIEAEDEVLLVIKTRAELLAELVAHLEREHPYETPECIALRPAEVARAYARWWSDSSPGSGR